MTTFQLETLTVRGSARELGRGQGEAFRERIERFIEMRFDAMRGYFADRGQPDGWTEVIDVGREGLALYEGWDREGYAEMAGLAEGAGVPLDRLFTATNMTDFRDAVLLRAPSGAPLTKLNDEGCSSVLLPAKGAPIAGQTWDLNPPDIDFIVAIRRIPDEGLQTWSVTCTGCLTLMGINERGVTVGTTNIKTYGSKPGVGYLSILHRSVRCESAKVAKVVIETAPHSGAHTYWVADEAQQFEWEASPNGQFLREATDAPVFRTNHCLAEAHQAKEGEVVGESSKARFAKLGARLSTDLDVEGLKAVFADRSDGLLSINRYAEDDQGTATNAVFIAEPAKRLAHACRGPADRGEWITLDFY
ncbi:MAG: C45 family peptidase [Myxococcota bacterium]